MNVELYSISVEMNRELADIMRRMGLPEETINTVGESMSQVASDSKILTTCSDQLKSFVEKLANNEYYQWAFKEKIDIIIARANDALVSMPMKPADYFQLPQEEQNEISIWLDSFTIFSPATIGSAFATMFSKVEFSRTGDRYEPW